MNNNEPPQKSPTNREKTSIFNHFWNNARHTKNKPFNIKTSKNKPKTPFCHVHKQPTIFHKFSVFFQHTVFVFEKLCFAENTIKIVFFRKTQLFKNTVSKTHFFNHVKNTLFQKKVSFLLFAISAETPIFMVFPALHCFGPKKILAKTV